MGTIDLPKLKGRARQLATYTTQGDILADDLQELADVMHFLFRRAGARVDHHVFDPAWETSTTGSYVTGSGSVSKNLDQLDTFLNPVRELDDGGTAVYGVAVEVYAEDFDLQIDLQNSANGSIQTTTLTGTSADRYEKGVLWAHGGSTEAIVKPELSAQAQSSLARIWQASVLELQIDDPALVPDTLYTV